MTRITIVLIDFKIRILSSNSQKKNLQYHIEYILRMLSFNNNTNKFVTLRNYDA